MSTPTPQQLRHLVRSRAAEFLADPNVSSVGIGHKVVDGRVADEISLQFTVHEKLPADELEAFGTRPIPEEVDHADVSVRTDVLERAFLPAYHVVPEQAPDERRTVVDPVRPGVSVGGWSTSAGTAGVVVHDRQSGEQLLLSNWHVLHGPEAEVGDDVHQPGPYDDNRLRETRLGTLRRSYLGLAGDCAVTSVDGRRVDPEVLDLGVTPQSLGEAELGDKVIKSGRTTGVTHGVVTRVDVVAKIPYAEVGTQQVGCLEISEDPNNRPADGRISDGGDSGAVWMFRARNGRTSTVVAGLHFAGDAPGSGGSEHALACLPSSVFDKLQISLSAEQAGQEAADRAAGAGFDTGFLSAEVPLPTLTGEAAGDAMPLRDGETPGDAPDDGGDEPAPDDPTPGEDAPGCCCGCACTPGGGSTPRGATGRPAFAPQGAEDGSDQVAHHTHFSLVLSRTRGLARWVAWNIDGGDLKRLSRKGQRFGFDPLYPEDAQVGEEVYRDNDLDRGHIARRADLLWGPTAEAERANADSFFFTNISPQMNDFNQAARHGVWGRLEDAVFEGAQVDRLRVSVLGGPVLAEGDPTYRGVQVPREFWKVLAYEVEGELRVKAFLLTQDLDRLEDLDLREFATYEVGLDELTERSGVAFPEVLHTPAAQSVEARRVRRTTEIAW